jgi:hypothetical protein
MNICMDIGVLNKILFNIQELILELPQYNVNKSLDKAMAVLLRDVGIAQYAVIAIQEPWICPGLDTTHSRVSQTIKHILMDCLAYDNLRNRIWTGDDAGIYTEHSKHIPH